jgi:hypothetical protein
MPATLLGGFLSDRLKRTSGPGGRMRLGATASLLAIPFWIALLFSANVPLLLVANFVLLGLSLIWIAPAMADVHDITGPHLAVSALERFCVSRTLLPMPLVRL